MSLNIQVLGNLSPVQQSWKVGLTEGGGGYVSDRRALPGLTMVNSLLLFCRVDSQCFLALALLPSTMKGHSRQALVKI